MQLADVSDTPLNLASFNNEKLSNNISSNRNKHYTFAANS